MNIKQYILCFFGLHKFIKKDFCDTDKCTHKTYVICEFCNYVTNGIYSGPNDRYGKIICVKMFIVTILSCLLVFWVYKSL